MRTAIVRVLVVSALFTGLALLPTGAQGASFTPYAPGATTATPIQHLVVIFQENASFDHYFGTYPNAANPADGSPAFTPAPGTPPVHGLSDPSPLGGTLLTNNPNRDGSGNQVNPFRFSRSQALTCDQDHTYADEQKAFDNGAMDRFPTTVSTNSCPTFPQNNKGTQVPNEVMGYYDGNTVTGLWNLAQHFSLSDNAYTTVYGPSTPGAMNLISGNTNGVAASNVGTPCTTSTAGHNCSAAGNFSNNTVIGDPDPLGDDCSNPNRTQVTMGDSRSSGHPNTSIGDLLSGANQTWGWFQGGFAPTAVVAGKATCGSQHANIGGNYQGDYSPHHEPFQYFPSTINQHHLAPASPQQIGQDDPSGTADTSRVNHQYDLSAFYSALQDHNLPAVSFLKASQYQDGHPGDSDPLDEQTFIADVLDQLQQSPEWAHTAVVITYDDSDGWYDHSFQSPLNPSNDPANDFLNGGSGATGLGCGSGTPAGGAQDRCGPGTRVPLLVVSPWAKQNYVDHTLNDQTSILKFVEENWNLPQLGNNAFESLSGGDLTTMFDFNAAHARAPQVLLDDQTGQVLAGVTGPPGQGGQPGPGGQQGGQGQHGERGERGAKGAVPHILCSATRHGKTIRIRCREVGQSKAGRKGKKRGTRVRATLLRNGRIVARGSGSLASIRMRSRRTLSGLYLLRVTAAGAASDSQAVML